MVNFGPLAAEICWQVWDTPANFNGFRVLAASLHSTSSGRRPNFAALNRGRQLYSAGRPSRWALAHVLVLSIPCSHYPSLCHSLSCLQACLIPLHFRLYASLRTASHPFKHYYLNQIFCAEWFLLFMAALCNRGAIIFLPCSFFLSIFSLSSLFYSSPNLSGRRLDVYHTSTYGVALVRI